MVENLEQKFFERILRPGDVLVFNRGGLFGWAIRTKTYGRASHVETYIGQGKTVGSRDGIGVNTFDLDPSGLVVVLRPSHFDVENACAWHKTVIGQRYDWLGLFWSFYAIRTGSDNHKMFCSEHATRFARQGGFEPFSPETDADGVSPADFLRTPAYQWIWRAPGYASSSPS